MSLYRFEVYASHHAVDPETVDLPDSDAARREGVRRAGATLVLDAHKLNPRDDWHLDVRDERGTLLFRFDFAMTVSPAASA